jgi:hypothetical protein
MQFPIPAFMAHAAWITRAIEDVMSQEDEGVLLLRRFPRDVAALASYSLDIPIIRQPRLSTHLAHEFFCALRGGDQPNTNMTSPDRLLDGLLHIGPPSNLILIREEISFLSANYVIAHEISHFFADVFMVQQRWMQSLPERVDEIKRVFLWQRKDDWLELQALIKGLPSRPRQIMSRGRAELPETAARERQADLIACELLAPWHIVAPLFQQNETGDFLTLLSQKFGLPRWVARGYLDNLRMALSPRPDAIDRLFGPLVNMQNEEQL